MESFSTPHYTEKTGGLLCCQAPAPNLLGRHSAYQTGKHQVSHGIPPATPGKKQTVSLHLKKKTLNNKKGTEN
jgi:hypothetical protein